MSDDTHLRLQAAIPALRRYARVLTRDPSQADDLVQDCLERALIGQDRRMSMRCRSDKEGALAGSFAYLALMDVEASTNAAETQALRELLQILSHEIMNSLTPIVSLSTTAAELFSEVPTRETEGIINETLATTRRRANGLDRFVRGYRDLARLPAADLQPIDLGELLSETGRLFDARWTGRVALELSLRPERIMVRLDQASFSIASISQATISKGAIRLIDPQKEPYPLCDGAL